MGMWAFKPIARIFPITRTAALFLRLPINPAHLAPYIFGGGGRNWNAISAWKAMGGGVLNSA